MYANELWAWVACFAAAYMLGSISGAITVSKLVFKTDIRGYGSGNAGLTNALRTFGKKSAVLVTAIDIAKTAAAILLGRWLVGELAVVAAGAGVVLGHAFPLYYRFRGGKCVLSSAVIVAFLDPRVFLAVMAVFALTILLSKMVSLGSILAAATAVAATAFFARENFIYIIFIVVLAAFVTVLHRGNIKRIIAGTEHRLGEGGAQK